MNKEQSLAIFRDYKAQSNPALIEAINQLVADVTLLSAAERRFVHDQCWRIAWDSRFLSLFPHDKNNPGVVADSVKNNFYYEGSKPAILSILKESEEGLL